MKCLGEKGHGPAFTETASKQAFLYNVSTIRQRHLRWKYYGSHHLSADTASRKMAPANRISSVNTGILLQKSAVKARNLAWSTLKTGKQRGFSYPSVKLIPDKNFTCISATLKQFSFIVLSWENASCWNGGAARHSTVQKYFLRVETHHYTIYKSRSLTLQRNRATGLQHLID